MRARARGGGGGGPGGPRGPRGGGQRGAHPPRGAPPPPPFLVLSGHAASLTPY